MERRELFGKLFAIADRKALAKDPRRACSMMADLRFDERDLNMAWYLCRAAPEEFSKALSGEALDIEEEADLVAARTRLDRDRLLSFLADLQAEV